MGDFSSSKNNEAKPLPHDRDLLLRLLDRCDETLSDASELGDYLHKRIKEEEDLRQACDHLTPTEVVNRMSGWGVASQDFSHRFHDLSDRMKKHLTPLKPHLPEDTDVPPHRWNEIMGMLSGRNSTDEVLTLRQGMVRICIVYLEWLVQLSQKILNLKSDIEHSFEDGKNSESTSALEIEQNKTKPAADDSADYGPVASMKKYASASGFDPRTLKKRIDSGFIRAKKISERRWQISMVDLSTKCNLPKEQLRNRLLDTTR